MNNKRGDGLAPRVLVLDGMWNKTLAAVRSLGRRGFHVTVGETTRFCASFFSRYASRTIVYPSPSSRPGDFIGWLIGELKTGSYSMVLPTEFATQQVVASVAQEVRRYAGLPFPEKSLADKVHDKGWLMSFAAQKGYLIPKTRFVPDAAAIDEVSEGLTFPAVIKPRHSSGSRGIAYVRQMSGFRDAYLKVQRSYPDPLVQEYIPPMEGGGCGVGALFNMDGEPRAAFAYRRLRQYPVSGGPSTLRESIDGAEIKDIAISLLKDLGWKGPAMVEFRIDPRDSKPRLLEINPRLWGSLNLAVESGVDFPFLLHQLAVTGDCDQIFEYKLGVRCRWLIPGDIMHLLTNPSRLVTLRKFFEPADADDILSIRDPMPLLGRLTSFLPLIFDADMRRLLSRR